MPNEWYNKVAGGVANMDDYIEQVGASGMLAPVVRAPSQIGQFHTGPAGGYLNMPQATPMQMNDYVTFGDAIGRPYDSPTFDAGLVGLGEATWAESFASVVGALGTVANSAIQTHVALQQNEINMDKAQLEVDAMRDKLAAQTAARTAATAGGAVTGGLGTQVDQAYMQAQQQIAQLQAAINAKKPFYKNPLALGAIGVGALAVFFLLK